MISLAVPATSAQDLAGRAIVVDGDTIEVHGTRIRLFGIDAPESAQLCRRADSKQYPWVPMLRKNSLPSLNNDRLCAHQLIVIDTGGSLAVCSIAGVDLGDWMVRSGLAVDFTRHSRGKYATAQKEAEFAKRAMWSGSFVAPWDFRSCLKSGGRNGTCSENSAR